MAGVYSGFALAFLLVPAHGPAQTAQVVGSWTFNDDPPGLAIDSGPQGLDGRVTGAQYVVGAGEEGLAVRFDGQQARVDMPRCGAYAFDDRSSFALTLWVRTTAKPAPGHATLLMARDETDGTVSFSLTLGRQPGRLGFELWSWPTVKLMSRQRVNDGRWHYIAAAYDAHTNRAYLYVDDELQAVRSVGRGGPGQASLRLGNNILAHQPYAGDIDDVTIFRGIPEEIASMNSAYEQWLLLDPAEITRAQQAYLERMAGPRFFRAASAQEWREHAARVREHTLRCLGLWPLPERLRLNLHISGTIEHESYVLQRVYWQTWPDYYASGYLYLPRQGKFPTAGILCPHGHWENGARHPIVQARCISLAMKGYVVLAVDSVHVYNWSAGLVPLTVMCWNNIRGFDLLCSLPQVDPSRLGCTGCSGGGQQTFYMMALEDRLSVAIPVGMVSEWRRILFPDWHHCQCNHVPGILTQTDTPELAACFAPRPALIITDTGDWTAWLPQEGFPAIKRVYELFGAGEMVRNSHYDWGHDYSRAMREEAYGWFNRFLMGITDPAQAMEPAHVPETLETLASLDGPPAGAVGPESIAAELLRRRGFAAPSLEPDAAAVLATIRDQFVAFANEAQVRDTEQVRQLREPEQMEGLIVERLAVTSELEFPVPVVVVSGSAGEGQRRPAAILLDPEGKANLLTTRQDLVRGLAQRGVIVCVPDPRPFGELGLHRPAQDMNGVVLGRPELVVAAHDVKRVAEYLRSRPDVAGDQVMCAGFGDGAPVVLAAGLLDSQLQRLAALEVGDTYAARDRLPRAPQILTVTDLPQMAGALAPRALWLHGVAQPEAFDWTVRAYQAMQAAGQLLISTGEVADADLVAWLGAPVQED